MIAMNLMFFPPRALIKSIASTAEPPVASIGSVTTMVRSSIGVGACSSIRAAHGLSRRGRVRCDQPLRTERVPEYHLPYRDRHVRSGQRQVFYQPASECCRFRSEFLLPDLPAEDREALHSPSASQSHRSGNGIRWFRCSCCGGARILC